MIRYIFSRVLQSIPLIFIILCISFFLVRLAPGDPVMYAVGDAVVSQEYIDSVRAEFGFDKPLYQQFYIYITQLMQGNLGYSYISREEVSTILISRLPATLLLLGAQFVLSIFIGIILGVWSAYRQGKLLDQSVTILSLVGFSIPSFWLAQMLMLAFSLHLGWFPAQGMRSLRYDLEGFAAFLDVMHHLALPALTLTIFNMALIARVCRSSMINTLRMEYVTFARSKGVRERTVVWLHALRNAILPVVTIIGLNFRTLIAGAVLTETVFSWPGIGRLTYDVIISRDYPVLMGILVLIGITVVIGNILTDIAYSILDPRVRYQ